MQSIVEAMGRACCALAAALCIAGPGEATAADAPASATAAAESKLLQLFVAAPYLDLRTGPGRGYPVTQVVARGESLDVLFRRTDYFKVRTTRGFEGWAAARDLQDALLADGSAFKLDLGDRSGFQSHGWELGALAGDFDGANLVSLYGARSINDHLKIELSASQYLGEQRSGWMVEGGLTHVFAPEWRFSPFITLGGGLFRVDKDAQRPNLVDRSDQSAYAGIGARFYLTRRFFLRGEFKERIVFTSRNDNEELKEWKVGLAFFF